MSIDVVKGARALSPFKGGTYLVHREVADLVNDAHEMEFWMAIPKFARLCRMHPSSVRRALREMENAGWLHALDGSTPDERMRNGRPFKYVYTVPDDTPLVWDADAKNGHPDGPRVERPWKKPAANPTQDAQGSSEPRAQGARGSRPPREEVAPTARHNRREPNQNENPLAHDDSTPTDFAATVPPPSGPAEELILDETPGVEPVTVRANRICALWEQEYLRTHGAKPAGNPMAARKAVATVLAAGMTDKRAAYGLTWAKTRNAAGIQGVVEDRVVRGIRHDLPEGQRYPWQREQAARAEAPARRDAWMGSVSAGEVEAREAQEAFHRARLAAAGHPAAPPVQTPPAARAGRLRDPLRDRQPAPPTAPDPAA